MAHGPCGEQFRAAFSCFVFSKDEPKGVDCIEHFKTMQNCFREHPDVYGSELDDDEDPSAESLEGQPVSGEPAPAPQAARLEQSPSQVKKVPDASPRRGADPQPVFEGEKERVQSATEQVRQEHSPVSEADEAVPKAWHDSRDANTGK